VREIDHNAFRGSRRGLCRTRVVRRRDIAATRTNCFTGGRASYAMTPVDFDSDRGILDAALPLIGLTEPCDARLMWIRNTSDLVELACSAAYLDEAKSRPDLEVLCPLCTMPLDQQGNLPDDVTGAWFEDDA